MLQDQKIFVSVTIINANIYSTYIPLSTLVVDVLGHGLPRSASRSVHLAASRQVPPSARPRL